WGRRGFSPSDGNQRPVIGREIEAQRLTKETRAMKNKRILTIAILAGVLAAVGGRAIFAQDKYAVKVPGGLAFSEFRGYEAWQTIAISRNEKAVAVILGNPVMIDAYRAGIPG